MNINIMAKLPMIKSGTGTPAQNYLAAARNFFLGVEALSSKGDLSLSPACAYLAAQTLECALKAYLSQSGVPGHQLKSPSLRHNLEELWGKANSEGLNISAQPPSWCVILNQTHDKPYYLRYPIGINGFQTPAYVPMVSELEILLSQVQAEV